MAQQRRGQQRLSLPWPDGIRCVGSGKMLSNEKRESTAEEAERLRRYLIIKVTVDWYKGPEGVMRVRS